MNFEEYLQQRGLKPVTVYQHRKYTSYFLAWLTGESLSLEQVSFKEILDYADQQKQENKGIGLVNRMLLAIRYYFSWLQEQNKVSYNPVAGIRLKGSVKTVPGGLLEKQEVEALYESYAVKDDRSQRNKVILSLLVYQGLTSQELHQLRAEHIRLKEGKVYVPANEHTNSRMLKLEAFQIMELYEYIHVTRSKILVNRIAERSGRKPKVMEAAEQISQLFISMNGCENIKNSLYHLNQALRRLNPKYKNAVQLRQSVITEWLKEKDLRTVQYMAGHKYVSSTERYQTSNLEDLKEALNKHHPLK
ncbi:tyrosine-type recombinase/integrase [Pedobacter cryoconitis]|uniref:tyrosine-type recombinase/integrase n=1 Tax=Pedobacter cryoconitis TaxID=188932 RepID=UPI00160943C0|nr:tyrosine-type recombinase/integrase [Pedobacter cryoconitis]MBB5649189.1 integrase/recombinase XerD [Pedobacter cryoconitis]